MTPKEKALAAAYAKQRGEMLKKTYPRFHAVLSKSGTLQLHLQTLGQQAAEMHQSISDQMRSRLLADKELPYQQGVKELEAIPHVARECVLNDLVLAPPQMPV